MTKRARGSSGFKSQTLFVIFPLLVGVVLFAAIVACVGRSAWDRVFDDPARLPAGTEAAIVLGTAPRLEDGTPNPHFEARLDAAAALWRSGRVRRVIVSGNNDGHGYDEPTAMRDGLARRGVPMDVVTLDPAGFRTVETVRRARGVFDVGNGGAAVFVMDPFHAPRTLFLADRAGGPGGAVVLAGAEVPWRLSWRSRLRELLADVRALGDLG